MPLFELVCITKAGLASNNMADLLRLSAGVVLSRGGVVRGFTNLGERLLPHRIRSRQVWHSEGKYWMMHFDCNPATMAELRQTLKLDPRVLRPSILKLGDRLSDSVRLPQKL